MRSGRRLGRSGFSDGALQPTFGAAWARNNYANTLLMHGLDAEAKVHLTQAIQIFEEIGMPDPTPMVNLGWVYLHNNELDAAKDAFLTVATISRRLHKVDALGFALLGLGLWLHHRGRPLDAAVMIGGADSLFDQAHESWPNPERRYREELVTSLIDALGPEYHSQYRAGRLGDPDDELSSLQNLSNS